ncbi:MAG: SDR family oxidoreductase [Pseudomonadota bacterium]
MTVTLITGASEGIGRELAHQIAETQGADVTLVLAARRGDLLEQVAQDLRAYGSRVECIPTDVSDQTQCRALIADTITRCGRLDVLIHNAGVSAHANFEQVTEADLDWYADAMTINYWSVVWLTHAALPHLLASKGLVVGVSSLAGLVGVPGRTAYCGTKFAMNGFLEALRCELAPKGLRVMIAYPGTVDTNLRKHGLGPGGTAPGVSMTRDDQAMSVETCARHIRRGIERGKREVLMTPKARLGRWLRLIAPAVVDRMAMREIKDQFRP